MQSQFTLKGGAPVQQGIVVDTRLLTARRQQGAEVERTLRCLCTDATLHEIGYPGPEGGALLIAFPGSVGEAGGGLLLRATPSFRARLTTVERLAVLLVGLGCDDSIPAHAVAPAAVALRLAHAGGIPPVALAARDRHRGAQQVREAMEHLQGHLAESFTTASIAARHGMATARFSAAFKRVTGLPLRQWVIRQRVERAQRMLADEANSLEHIAVACGFGEQCHFTRQFARVTGLPPGAWRRQLPAFSR